ncbi:MULTISPECIES: cysteine hydrolase family protein [unclassified Rhodococcus (in: high G+C Gram-positive bacteria)]|uniref:cysteine hydrolase family protein n=1 Tax=unclassified Rhodococcus (in: high G+C Gram-positive bacteria) TaxID=192944 RepID=UPI00163A3CD4|nr:MULTISPECIES: isochorismatase family cysteine hydrolase [unclassified Rhodococcus (in: high G+C Gram-positive bacteria)]MBC2637791.1 cysteine hydrolase [Rhodococcus sp. 3A]MBC2897464.1 cysteine hydrolase [Rhodococcus sp. 4CII]
MKAEISAPIGALLLMDLQNCILSGISNSDELLSVAESLKITAHENTLETIYVRVAFDESDYRKVPAENKAFWPIAQNRALGSMSADSAIAERISPESGDQLIITKTRCSAFSGTHLLEHLRSHGLRLLLISGASTSGVVLSTSREAADLDFKVAVVSDACGDFDSKIHQTLVEDVLPLHLDVITANEVSRYVENYRDTLDLEGPPSSQLAPKEQTGPRS